LENSFTAALKATNELHKHPKVTVKLITYIDLYSPTCGSKEMQNTNTYKYSEVQQAGKKKNKEKAKKAVSKCSRHLFAEYVFENLTRECITDKSLARQVPGVT